MIKVIEQWASIALIVLAFIGLFGAPKTFGSFKWQYIVGAAIALLALFSARSVIPGHELMTLAGAGLLLVADFIWLSNTYAKSHGVSLFGWFQAHKKDADFKADLQTAAQTAKDALATDTTGATTAAAAVVKSNGTVVAAAAVGVVESAVKEEVATKLTNL